MNIHSRFSAKFAEKFRVHLQVQQLQVKWKAKTALEAEYVTFTEYFTAEGLLIGIRGSLAVTHFPFKTVNPVWS